MVRGVRVKEWLLAVVVLVGIAAGIALAAQATTDDQQGNSASGGLVYWTDGDSGRLPDGTKFRLHGVDAPETTSVKWIHGAKCELERELGFNAKARVLELTRGKTVAVSRNYGRDKYKRLVVDLSVEGQDLAEQLISGGTHKRWDYDGGQRKPVWCGAQARPSLAGSR